MEIIVETQPCPRCGNTSVLDGIDAEGFELWLAGEYIQDALPSLTADERELLISGTHAHCWQAMWGVDYEG